jgi:S1-C subfamily serine protease
MLETDRMVLSGDLGGVLKTGYSFWGCVAVASTVRRAGVGACGSGLGAPCGSRGHGILLGAVMKVYACAILIFIGFIGNYVAGAQLHKSGADPAVASIAQMKPSVVQIKFKSDSAKTEHPEGIVGTGIVVSDEGYVLTAAHVITETEAALRADSASKVEFFVGIFIEATAGAGANSRGSFAYIACTVKDTDPVHDIAILQLTQNPFSEAFRLGIKIGDKEPKVTLSVAKLDQSLPPEGQTVLVSGYPLSSPTLVTQKGMVASETYTVVHTQPPNAPTGLLSTEVEDTILLDAVVNPGNSGGPVYLPGEHAVIGICDAYELSPIFTTQRPLTVVPGVGQNSGLAVVIPIKYAIALLQKNKIETKLP